MENQEVILITNQLIPLYFPDNKDIDYSTNSYSSTKDKLTSIIRYLLDRDFEKLLSILYRIDVDEQAFKNSLLNENVTESVTDLVLTRLMQKAEMRLRYRSF